MRRTHRRHLSLLGGALLAAMSAAGAAAQTAAGDTTLDGSTPLHQAVRQNDLKTVERADQDAART